MYCLDDLPDTIICKSFRLDINPISRKKYMVNHDINEPFCHNDEHTGWITPGELIVYLNTDKFLYENPYWKLEELHLVMKPIIWNKQLKDILNGPG